MYLNHIVYERNQQRVVDPSGNLAIPNFSPNEYPTMYKKYAPAPTLDDIYGPRNPSSFKPTWLIRVSDMKRVPGSEVKERYYALSYSWSQSGDCSKKNDGASQQEQREHKLIFYRKRVTRKQPRGRTKTRVAVKPKIVHFEEMIQKICKDFGALYIWWDQWCINQMSKEDKQREIKKMHQIYKNAYCAIVLVPELDFTGVKDDYFGYNIANLNVLSHAQWVTRSWTLEEAFMAKRMLFLGRNVHMWSHVSDGNMLSDSNTAMFLRAICTRSLAWNACTALQYARRRTSTKAHDRYFALANMFPEKMHDLNSSYSQPLNDLALWFYDRLAADDPSILYFGTPIPYDAEDGSEIKAIRQTEDESLPSWTGTEGLHVRRLFLNGKHNLSEGFGLSPSDYSVSGTAMTITCTSISVSIVKENDYDQSFGLWARSADSIAGGLTISSSKSNHLTFVVTTGYNMYDDFRIGTAYGLRGTHFLPLKAESNSLVNTISSPHLYGGLMSLTEDCDECIILFGVSYLDAHLHFCRTSPVVTKDGDHYRAIGVCLLFEAEKGFPNIVSKRKQTFIIK